MKTGSVPPRPSSAMAGGGPPSKDTAINPTTSSITSLRLHRLRAAVTHHRIRHASDGTGADPQIQKGGRTSSHDEGRRDSSGNLSDHLSQASKFLAQEELNDSVHKSAWSVLQRQLKGEPSSNTPSSASIRRASLVRPSTGGAANHHKRPASATTGHVSILSPLKSSSPTRFDTSSNGNTENADDGDGSGGGRFSALAAVVHAAAKASTKLAQHFGMRDNKNGLDDCGGDNADAEGQNNAGDISGVNKSSAALSRANNNSSSNSTTTIAGAAGVDNNQALHVVAQQFLDRQKYYLKRSLLKKGGLGGGGGGSSPSDVNTSSALSTATGGGGGGGVNSNTSIQDQAAREREESAKLFLIYRDLINLFAEKLQANLGPIFTEVSTEMNNFLELFQNVSRQLSDSHAMIEEFENSFVRRTDEIRSGILREVKSLFKTSIQREHEGEVVHQVTVELERKLTALKLTEEKQLETISKQSVLIKELSRELNIKNSIVNEIQRKTNEIIAENKYLRNICAHNNDLLKEIEVRKQNAQYELENHTDVTRRLRSEINSLTQQKAAFHSHQKALKDVIKSQQDEITLLRQGHSEMTSLFAQVKNERDDYLEVYTPRPECVEAVAWLKETELQYGGGHFAQYVEGSYQAGASALGGGGTAQGSVGEAGGANVTTTNTNTTAGTTSTNTQQQVPPPPPKKKKIIKKIPTHIVCGCLLRYATDLQHEVDTMRSKLQLQAKLVEFLQEDDFEKLQRVTSCSALSLSHNPAAATTPIPVVVKKDKKDGDKKGATSNNDTNNNSLLTSSGSTMSITKAASASFYVHSRCVAALGTHEFIPKHLRFSGYVAIRAMPLDEVLILIDEMRNERASLRQQQFQKSSNNNNNNTNSNAILLSSSSSDFSEYLDAFFSARYGGAQAVKDLAYSYEYSCSLTRFAPQVDLWIKISSGFAPEGLFDEALHFLRAILENMKYFIAKHGTPTERKKRCVKKKTLFEYIAKLLPWFSDAELVRFKAILHDETMNVDRIFRSAIGMQTSSMTSQNASQAKRDQAKDEVPIELLLDPEVDPNAQFYDDPSKTAHLEYDPSTHKDGKGKPVDPAAAAAAANNNNSSGAPTVYTPTGISMLSPFASAIFRAFVNEYESHRNDVASEVFSRAKAAFISELRRSGRSNVGGTAGHHHHHRGSGAGMSRTTFSTSKALPNNILQRSGSLAGGPTGTAIPMMPSADGNPLNASTGATTASSTPTSVPLEEIEVSVLIFTAALRTVDTHIINATVEFLVSQVFTLKDNGGDNGQEDQQQPKQQPQEGGAIAVEASTPQSPVAQGSPTSKDGPGALPLPSSSSSSSPSVVARSTTSSSSSSRRGRLPTFDETLAEKYNPMPFPEFYSKFCQLYFLRTVVVTSMATAPSSSSVNEESGSSPRSPSFFPSGGGGDSVATGGGEITCTPHFRAKSIDSSSGGGNTSSSGGGVTVTQNNLGPQATATGGAIATAAAVGGIAMPIERSKLEDISKKNTAMLRSGARVGRR